MIYTSFESQLSTSY